MDLSISEISSATKNSNLGMVSLAKTFTNNFLYKMSVYFMAFIYLPINFFVMQYYVIMQIQDAFGWETQWWIVAIIVFIITVWIVISAGLSAKFGNIQNKIISLIKFFPFIFCVAVGLTIVIKFGGVETTKWNWDMLNENTARLH